MNRHVPYALSILFVLLGVGGITPSSEAQTEAGGFTVSEVDVGGGPTRIVKGDFLGSNGYPDLAVTNPGSNDVSLLKNDGAGAFHEEKRVPAGENPFDIAAANLDGDDDSGLDLIVVNRDYENSGKAETGVTIVRGPLYEEACPLDQVTPASVSFGNPYGVVAADFNEDEHPDLAVIDEEARELIVFTNASDSESLAFTESVRIETVGTPTFVRAADFDADGRDDLVITQTTEQEAQEKGQVVIYRNTSEKGGDIEFASYPEATKDAGRRPMSVVPIDVGDRLDLVVADSDWGSANEEASRDVYVFKNEGAFSFSHVQTLEVGQVPRDLTLGQFDDEPGADVAVVNLLDGDVSFLMNDGTGTFTVGDWNEPVGKAGIVSGDFDGDALDDLAVVSDRSSESGKISILLREAALPVELVAFDAVTTDADVVLSWATAGETDNAGFEVERASGDAEFERVGFVDGYGTTTEIQQYTHRVRDVQPGTYTFRLRQIDYDGTSTYSPEVEVQVEPNAAYAISEAYPNPFTAQTAVDLVLREPQHVTITIYNTLGQRVRTLFEGTVQAHASRTFRLTAEDLPSGVYLYRIVGETFTETQRITLVR